MKRMSKQRIWNLVLSLVILLAILSSLFACNSNENKQLRQAENHLYETGYTLNLAIDNCKELQRKLAKYECIDGETMQLVDELCWQLGEVEYSLSAAHDIVWGIVKHSDNY